MSMVILLVVVALYLLALGYLVGTGWKWSQGR